MKILRAVGGGLRKVLDTWKGALKKLGGPPKSCIVQNQQEGGLLKIEAAEIQASLENVSLNSMLVKIQIYNQTEWTTLQANALYYKEKCCCLFYLCH